MAQKQKNLITKKYVIYIIVKITNKLYFKNIPI